MKKLLIEDEWELYMYLLKCAIWNETPDESIFDKYKIISANDLILAAKDKGQLLMLEKYIKKYSEFKK